MYWNNKELIFIIAYSANDLELAEHPTQCSYWLSDNILET